jgi:hypothetical protein
MFERPANHKRAQDEAKHGPSLHNDNLFDEDEDAYGERRDLATGKPIDNSTYTGMEGLTEVLPEDSSEDVLGTVKDDDDEAGRWLRENSK